MQYDDSVRIKMAADMTARGNTKLPPPDSDTPGYGGLHQALNDLEQSLSVTMARVEHLEMLAVPLMPPKPVGGSGTNGSETVRVASPVAERVNRIVQALDSVAWRIQQINAGLS